MVAITHVSKCHNTPVEIGEYRLILSQRSMVSDHPQPHYHHLHHQHHPRNPLPGHLLMVWCVLVARLLQFESRNVNPV